MKTPLLVGIIVTVHCVALGSVVLINGCGTTGPATAGKGEKSTVKTEQKPDRPEGGRIKIVNPQTPAPSETTEYTIREGETLSGIAQRFKVDRNAVVAINRDRIKDANNVRAGTKILLPGKIDIKSIPAVEKKPLQSGISPTTKSVIHIVKTGETLTKIAKAAGVSVQAIREVNNLPGDKIRIGQKLSIPVSEGNTQVETPGAPVAQKTVETGSWRPGTGEEKPTVKADAPANAGAGSGEGSAISGSKIQKSGKQVSGAKEGFMLEHTVATNEDLESIAFFWGVPVGRLQEVNGLTDNKVTPGQKLKIPANE